MYMDKDKYNLILARLCMTNAEVLQMAKISQATLNRVIRGERTTPATLGHIAKCLGVDVTEIMKQ